MEMFFFAVDAMVRRNDSCVTIHILETFDTPTYICSWILLFADQHFKSHPAPVNQASFSAWEYCDSCIIVRTLVIAIGRLVVSWALIWLELLMIIKEDGRMGALLTLRIPGYYDGNPHNPRLLSVSHVLLPRCNHLLLWLSKFFVWKLLLVPYLY